MVLLNGRYSDMAHREQLTGRTSWKEMGGNNDTVKTSQPAPAVSHDSGLLVLNSGQR